MNIGIIGLGEVADRFHAPALQELEGVTLYSVLGRTKEDAEKFAQRHKVQNYSHSHDASTLHAFLDDPALDAVIIATPDHLHIPYALAAVRAGKHVLIEKPVSDTLSSVFPLRSAVEKAGVVVAVGYHLRHHHGHQVLREKIKDGALGEITHLHFHWTTDYTLKPSWRNDSSPWWSLGALGTHCVDLASWLLNEDTPLVEDLSLLTNNLQYGKNDESALLSYKMNDTFVSIYTSVLYKSPFQFDLYGKNDYASATWTLGSRGGGKIKIGGDELPFEKRNLYLGQLRDFKNAIQGKGFGNLASLADGIWNLKVLGGAEKRKTTGEKND
ncbi:Gfo/Idh/MocA family oxidoreductase [Candidatus Woesearchaeota archaeon]|nr:Gfo/Idh/MocA family oxidoreductase [Candidatus Woesearchaeota archaeon]